MAEEFEIMLEEGSSDREKVNMDRDHYDGIVDDIIKEVEDHIWDLCSEQQAPLPGRTSDEVNRWRRFNRDNEVTVGFVPPREHRNESFAAASD